MTEMLIVPNKDLKATVINMLQWAITKMLETKEQKVMARKGFTKETKEEKPNGDFRNKKDKN